MFSKKHSETCAWATRDQLNPPDLSTTSFVARIYRGPSLAPPDHQVQPRKPKPPEDPTCL